MATFGEWLREAREAREMSLREFSRRTQLSPTYVSHIETGKAKPPTVERCIAIAKLLKEPTDDVVLLAGHVPPDLVRIYLRRPELIGALIREANKLTPEGFRVARQFINTMKNR